MRYIALYLLFVLTFAACVKVDPECELVLMPRLLETSGSNPLNPTYQARVYAFYIDGKDKNDPVTKNWKPTDWTDAESGVIRNSVTGEVKSFNLVAEQVTNENISLTVTRSPVLLVAVDPQSRMWGSRVVDYKIPLPKLSLIVKFQPWKEIFPYTEIEWEMDKMVEN